MHVIKRALLPPQMLPAVPRLESEEVASVRVAATDALFVALWRDIG